MPRSLIIVHETRAGDCRAPGFFAAVSSATPAERRTAWRRAEQRAEQLTERDAACPICGAANPVYIVSETPVSTTETTDTTDFDADPTADFDAVLAELARLSDMPEFRAAQAAYWLLQEQHTHSQPEVYCYCGAIVQCFAMVCNAFGFYSAYRHEVSYFDRLVPSEGDCFHHDPTQVDLAFAGRRPMARPVYLPAEAAAA